MEAPRTVRPIISRKELAERTYIHRTMKAVIHYCESKLQGFPLDCQLEVRGNVWRAVLTAEWVPQPIPPVLEPMTKPEGAM